MEQQELETQNQSRAGGRNSSHPQAKARVVEASNRDEAQGQNSPSRMAADRSLASRRGRPRKLSGNNLNLLAIKEEVLSDES